MGLFEKLRQYLQITRHGENQAMARNVLHFAPKHINGAGQILFDNLQLIGKSVFFVPGRTGWNPNADYFRAIRDAARRGVNISRIFVIPNIEYINEPLLKQQFELDRSSGIKVEFILSSKEFEQNFQFPLFQGTLDYGFWDNELVSFIIFNKEFGSFSQSDEWLISKRPEDVEIATEHWEVITQSKFQNILQQEVILRKQMEGLLAEPAVFASMLSDILCHGDFLDPSACHWYHGVWLYLRMFDLVPSSTWFSSFFINEVPRGFPENSTPPKILIVEPFDFSLLALIIEAYKERIHPDITIINSCQTPLLLNQWFATKEGYKIDSVNENFLNCKVDKQFDLIISNDIFTYYENDNRSNLVGIMGNHLEKNGKIVMVNRISKQETVKNERHLTLGREVSQLVEQKTRYYKEYMPINTDALSRQTRHFMERYLEFVPVLSEKFIDFFSKENFRIEKYQIVDVKTEMGNDSFATIVAYRI